MLKELKADGELEILRPGIGRDQKRIIRLTRYATIKGDTAMTPLHAVKPDKAMTAKPDKAMTGLNRTRSGAKRRVTDTDNCQEQPTDHAYAYAHAHTRGSANGESKESFLVVNNQNQNQPAQSHPKFPEFAAWCRSQRDKHGNPGKPTERGFWKWLCGQKPQWRNKVRQDFDAEGYVLDGKFLTQDEANQRGKENPELITRMRKVVKRDGKIQVT